MGLTKLQFKKAKDEEEVLRQSNYRKGYRMVLECLICATSCYGKTFNDYSECDCGNVGIEENSYYYKESVSDGRQVRTKMIKYTELAK